MIHYLLHTSILLTFSFLFYWVFLKKETFYNLNRYFLIAAFFGSMLIPLISIPSTFSFNSIEIQNVETSSTLVPATPDNKINSNNENFEVVTPTPPNTPDKVIEQSTFLQKVKGWNLNKIIWVVYLLGTSVFLITFLIQFVILLMKKNKLQSIKDGKYTIYELEDDSSPFSFFHWIFINPAAYDPDTFEQILDHEKIHVSQSHYIDKLLAEMAVILFWYNPFAWLFRKVITNNLEFLTDSEILENGTEPESYQMSLLRVSVPQHALSLTTNYNESFLEQRIRMMNERKSSAKSSWKYLLTIPLILISMASLNAVHFIPEVTSNDSLVQLESESIEDEDNLQHFNDELADELENELDHNISNLASDLDANIPEEYNSITDEECTKECTKDQFGNVNHNHNLNVNVNLSKNINNSIESAVSEAVGLGLSEAAKALQTDVTTGNHDGWYHDLKPGHWRGTIENKEICVFMNNSVDARSRWTTSTCYDKSVVGKIQDGEPHTFAITKEQGTLTFTGVFEGNIGSGTFQFEESQDFKAYLKSKNIGTATSNEMFIMFLNEFNAEAIEELLSQGYDLSVDKIVDIGIHANGIKEIKEFEQVLKLFNIKDRNTNKLVEMAIHDVNLSFAKSIHDLNLTGVSLNKLIEAKIHGVDAGYVQELKDAGYDDLSINQVIEFAIHGVSSDDMNEIKEMGYDFPQDKLVEFQIHGVTPDFIEAFKKIGYHDLSANRLIEFAIHGVSPSDVKEMNDVGYTDITPSKLVEFAIHGVDSDFVKGFADIGYGDISSNKMVEFAIHGVSPSFVKEMQDIGYDDISSSKLVEMKIHGVNPDFIAEMKSMGYNDISINKIIEFAIHGVNSDYLNSLKKAGIENISTQNLIDGKIHGVSGSYYRSLKDLNVEGLSFQRLIEGRIHGVNEDFIKRARKKGYNPSSLSEYIDLKIHGL